MAVMDSRIWTDPERMSGTPCFTGTRVPASHPFESLEHDHSIGDFLKSFPTVKWERVVAVLQMAAAAVIPPSQPPAHQPQLVAT